MAALLVAVTFVSLLPVLHAGFIELDDSEYITANRHVLGGLTAANVRWALSATTPGYWQPLSWISLMADATLFGPTSAAFHRTNLLLHAASAAVVFWALCGLTGSLWRAALVAAIYAVHPLRVESVAWAAERKDVLSNLLAWVAIGGYAMYVRRPSARRYLLVLVPFGLALLAKPMVITLPFVLLLLDYWPLNRLGDRKLRALILEKTPLFMLAGAAAVSTAISQHQCGAIVTLAQYPAAARIGNIFISYGLYLWKMAWFHDLAVFYPLRSDWPWTRLGAAAAAAVALACFTAAAIASRKSRPWVVVGWLWFLGVLFPVCGVSQAGLQLLADRFTYLPSVGLIILAVWSLPRMPAWRAGALASCAVVGLSVSAWVQSEYWHDVPTLFGRALAVTDGNWIAYGQIGVIRFREGAIASAESEFRQALAVNPADSVAGLNLGICLAREGRPLAAITQYRKTLRWQPGAVEVRNNLGVELQHRGNFQAAYEQFKKALALRPDYEPALSNMGGLLAQIGAPDKAVVELKAAVALDPYDRLARQKLSAAAAMLAAKSAGADASPVIP